MLSFDDVARAIAHSPFYLTLIDRDGTVEWVSAVGYGYERGQLVGGRSDGIVLGEDRPAWWDAFLRARDGRENVRYSVRVNVPEYPHVIQLTGRIAPVIGAGGRVERLVAICFDSTREPDGLCVGCTHAARAPAAPTTLALSPDEEAILAALRGKGWRTREQVALDMGQELTPKLRAIMSNLAARGHVQAVTGKGFHEAT